MSLFAILRKKQKILEQYECAFELLNFIKEKGAPYREHVMEKTPGVFMNLKLEVLSYLIREGFVA